MGVRGCPSPSSTYRATGAHAQCGSATRPPRNASSTSTGICCRRRGCSSRPAVELSADTSSRLASTADLVCSIWSEEDSGIWEVRGLTRHFTQSKMMCWVALDRACRLAADGHIPGKNASRWQAEARDPPIRLRSLLVFRAPELSCASPSASQTDASILLPTLMGYGADDERQRLIATVRNIRAELGSWRPYLHRYRGEDGLPGQEGAFLACSFWLVDALAATR